MSAAAYWLRLSSLLRRTDEEPPPLGNAGDGRVLVATRLDDGEPVEWAWVEPDAIAQYDARNWRDPGGPKW